MFYKQRLFEIHFAATIVRVTDIAFDDRFIVRIRPWMQKKPTLWQSLRIQSWWIDARKCNAKSYSDYLHTMQLNEPIFPHDCRCYKKIYDTIQPQRKCALYMLKSESRLKASSAEISHWNASGVVIRIGAEKWVNVVGIKVSNWMEKALRFI